MLRGWPAYECGQHPPFNLHAGHTARFLTNSHTSVSRGLVMQKIACLEVGQYECGQGGGGCWQVNFTGQHSFCIFGQPTQGSRSTGNSVVAPFTFVTGNLFATAHE